jgi:ATP-dependent DNA helicase RecQ
MAYGRFDRGESLNAVADTIGKPLDAVLTYLLDYIGEKKLTSPEPWVDVRSYERIRDAAKRIGIARPISILRAVDGAISYDELRICIACLKNGE